MNVKKDPQQQFFQENPWKVYLSGEIHSDWREQIKEVLNTYQVPIQFSEPNTGHSDSDDCGSILLGSESDSFWHDHKGAGLNSIRRRKLIHEADIVVVRFGKNTNSGMPLLKPDRSRPDKSLISSRRGHDHALKEMIIICSSLSISRTGSRCDCILYQGNP